MLSLYARIDRTALSQIDAELELFNSTHVCHLAWHWCETYCTQLNSSWELSWTAREEGGTTKNSIVVVKKNIYWFAQNSIIFSFYLKLIDKIGLFI